jgi:hypothetical protein
MRYIASANLASTDLENCAVLSLGFTVAKNPSAAEPKNEYAYRTFYTLKVNAQKNITKYTH